MLVAVPMNEAQVQTVVLFAEEYNYGRDALHAYKVADIATSIFDQLLAYSLIPRLTIEDRRTLTAMCYVCDIGASPRIQKESEASSNRSDRYDLALRCGATAIQTLLAWLDSPAIPDLAPGDRSLLVYGLLWSTSPGTSVLNVEPLLDRRKTLLLTGILRMARGLDFRLGLRVSHVQVRKAASWLRFLVRGVGQAAEEVARCQAESRMLSEALHTRITVQEVVEG
jgi:hypothetical protein